jgi:outer membrane receptor protein involved in Fe transport
MGKVKSVASWIIICLFIALPNTEAKDKKGKKTLKLENVVVTASKKKETPDYVQDIITKIEIKQPDISGSIIDSLANKTGVQLRQGSMNGTENGKLRLRGFDETRLKILKDGVPIDRDGSYGNGPIDWSILSSENVERIEVHRGPGPAKFGNTLGGVINIITSKPDELPETSINTVYGSFGTWDTKAFHTWKKGPVGWRLSAGHYETDGYLRNNFSDHNNFNADLFLDLPYEIEIGGGAFYSDSQSGYPVYNRPDSPYFKSNDPTADGKELGGPGISSRLLDGQLTWGDGTKAEDENLAISAFAKKDFHFGHIRTDFRLWNQDRKEIYYTAENKQEIYKRNTKAEDNNWLWLAEGTLHSSKHQLEMGGEIKKYGWGDQSVDYIDESYFDDSINFFSFVKEGFKGQPDLLSYSALYLQDNWKLHPKVSLELGLRQEWFTADSVDPDAFGFEWEAAEQKIEENHLDPRVSLAVHPWKDGGIIGGIGMVHRYPTSPEYFWWYLNNGADFFNTDLNSEEALQYELGLEQTILNRFKLGLRGYYYDIKDYISSTTIPGTGQVVYNIGQVVTKGAEFSLSADLPHDLKPWANMTFQKAEKDDDPWDTDNKLTSELPDLPDTIVNIGMDYALSEILSARIWCNHVGRRKHLQGDELVTHDAYTLVNFSATYQIVQTTHTKWNLLFSAQNIFDESYQQKEGYPMPGVTIIGGIRLTL